MKNVFLSFITISFYCNIVCKNIVCDVGLTLWTQSLINIKAVLCLDKFKHTLAVFDSKLCFEVITGSPRYMLSFYLQFHVYAIEKWPFSGTYPLIHGNPRSIFMRIHYMPAYFWSPYLSHIMRSTCTLICVSSIHILKSGLN